MQKPQQTGFHLASFGGHVFRFNTQEAEEELL